MSAVRPWQEAWQDALYGPHGFYRRPEGPAGHFRTASHVPLFAEAIARLATDVCRGLGDPPEFAVVDVGAGRGELVTGLIDLVPDHWLLLAIDVVERPDHLDPRVTWSTERPEVVTGLVVAHELLDVIPCTVVEVDEHGQRRQVVVDPSTGEESLGGPADIADQAWLDRWWPVAEPGERAEVGRSRDELWQHLVGGLAGGAALAVDYAHGADDRGAGRWSRGTLVGHRRGRIVPAVPDGSCDLTAHVALDACAAATQGVVDATFLSQQREALRALGIDSALPPPETAAQDPRAYGVALQRAGQARELTEPLGWGAFGWLLQLKGVSPGVRARA